MQGARSRKNIVLLFPRHRGAVAHLVDVRDDQGVPIAAEITPEVIASAASRIASLLNRSISAEISHMKCATYQVERWSQW
jgi:hypothetical protein